MIIISQFHVYFFKFCISVAQKSVLGALGRLTLYKPIVAVLQDTHYKTKELCGFNKHISVLNTLLSYDGC